MCICMCTCACIPRHCRGPPLPNAALLDTSYTFPFTDSSRGFCTCTAVSPSLLVTVVLSLLSAAWMMYTYASHRERNVSLRMSLDTNVCMLVIVLLLQCIAFLIHTMCMTMHSNVHARHTHCYSGDAHASATVSSMFKYLNLPMVRHSALLHAEPVLADWFWEPQCRKECSF